MLLRKAVAIFVVTYVRMSHGP